MDTDVKQTADAIIKQFEKRTAEQSPEAKIKDLKNLIWQLRRELRNYEVLVDTSNMLLKSLLYKMGGFASIKTEEMQHAAAPGTELTSMKKDGHLELTEWSGFVKEEGGDENDA